MGCGCFCAPLLFCSSNHKSLCHNSAEKGSAAQKECSMVSGVNSLAGACALQGDTICGKYG